MTHIAGPRTLAFVGSAYTAVNDFLAKYQRPIAFALLAVLGLQLMHVFTLPHGVETAIVFALGALGVARPTETASKIVGEVMAVRGGASIAAAVAALAGLLTFAPAADPNPVEASDTKDDAIDLVFEETGDEIDVTATAKDVG